MSNKNSAISDEALIEVIARKVVEARLETIVIFFLETIAPMGRLWSQIARLYLQPLLILLGPYSEAFLRILQDPKKIEKLIDRIEELSEKQ